jgi:aromatic-L-amino-acid/L-tryptophan decarboxylase
MDHYPLELDRDGVRSLGHRALEFVADYLDQLPSESAWHPADPSRPVAELLGAPPEKPGNLDELLDRVVMATSLGLNPASAGYLAYFPTGGITSSAVAELIAQTVNRYTAFASLAPGLVAMEQSVIRWLCGQFGLPTGSGGLIMSGGSMATLPVVVAARDGLTADEVGRGVIYVGEHVHHSVAKAAHIAGLRDDQLRTVPSTADLRMDVAEAARLIAADRAAGLRPFMVVASAGATNTGLVDALGELGRLAVREDLWFHVDGAYGAPFQLTDRGRERLAGIELADSIVLDPHKSMFLPYGTGMLLVRDEHTLRTAHQGDGAYLQDISGIDQLPDYAALGPELTREYRGLRMWLPLHLHGVAAFRDALDEKIDLARQLHRELAAEPALEVPWTPDLTVVGFRLRGDGPDNAAANRRLLERINQSGRIFISSTRINGKYLLRMCPQSLRTHTDHVSAAVGIIRSALAA